jgi:dolichyl-phosphate beta-glucosyltransferase
MPESIRLSVIIPAYNEALRLADTLRTVDSYLSLQPYESEIIVVDDGSTDGTLQAARACETVKSLRLVQHPDCANHGKGASVRRGMFEARGAYRIFMDADNSTGSIEGLTSSSVRAGSRAPALRCISPGTRSSRAVSAT